MRVRPLGVPQKLCVFSLTLVNKILTTCSKVKKLNKNHEKKSLLESRETKNARDNFKNYRTKKSSTEESSGSIGSSNAIQSVGKNEEINKDIVHQLQLLTKKVEKLTLSKEPVLNEAEKLCQDLNSLVMNHMEVEDNVEIFNQLHSLDSLGKENLISAINSDWENKAFNDSDEQVSYHCLRLTQNKLKGH